jgi:hypothetical protein
MGDSWKIVASDSTFTRGARRRPQPAPLPLFKLNETLDSECAAEKAAEPAGLKQAEKGPNQTKTAKNSSVLKMD